MNLAACLAMEGGAGKRQKTKQKGENNTGHPPPRAARHTLAGNGKQCAPGPPNNSGAEQGQFASGELSNIEKRFPPPAGITARRPPDKLTALRACGAWCPKVN